MKRAALFSIAVVTAGALVGCGTDKRLPDLTGSGGVTGGPTGGTVGSTGGAGAGPGGMAGGGAGVTGGEVLDAGVCAKPVDPPVIPWNLVIPDAGTSSAAADGGGSGCQRTGSESLWTGTCSGPAWLRPGGGSPTLTWDDGAQLVWNTAAWSQPIAPPGAAATETRVWASLIREVRVPCVVCGYIETTTIEIRESAGGKLLFLAKEGLGAPEPTGDQLMALFGVAARTRATCTLADRDGCTAIWLTVNDHLIDTTPPQIVPPAVRTTVMVPDGAIQVIWTSSVEQQLGLIPGCADGTPNGPPMGFVASRL